MGFLAKKETAASPSARAPVRAPACQPLACSDEPHKTDDDQGLLHSCARRGSSTRRKPKATCSNVSTMNSRQMPGKTPSHHQPAVM